MKNIIDERIKEIIKGRKEALKQFQSEIDSIPGGKVEVIFNEETGKIQTIQTNLPDDLIIRIQEAFGQL